MRYGPEFLEQAYVRQMWERFAGGSEGPAQGSAWFKGLFRGQPLLEAPLIAAILAVPFVFRDSRAQTLTALFIIYVVMSGLAGEQGSARYAILFYPMMAASLAAIVAQWLGSNALVWLLAYSLVLGTPFKGMSTLRLDRSTQAPHFEFMQRAAAAAKPGESFVRCLWNRGKAPLFPGAISYYASGGRPVQGIPAADRIARAGDGPYRGICTLAEFEDLQPVLVSPMVVETSGNYVHWTAQGRK
jgi:hypothetical protein